MPDKKRRPDYEPHQDKATVGFQAGLDVASIWERVMIRHTLRRAVIFASRGLEEKKRIIQIGEILLARIDDEEWTQEEEAFNEEVRSDR